MGMALIMLVALGLVLFGLAAYCTGLYNQLVAVKVNVDKAWGNIDVLLKQRYDEIPKLVEVCEGYMKYEQETLQKITQARTQFLSARTPGEVAKADSSMAGALKSLFAVSENYPDLKANANFKQLQERVSYLENQIADRREFYNDSVAIFNTRIKMLPDMFIASLMGYAALEMYKVAEAERQPQDIKFNLPT